MMDSSDPASQKGKAKAESGCAPTRKPRILVAACGSIGAVHFGNICRSFLEWAEVRAVSTKSSLHFILPKPEGVSLFFDEHDWNSWKKIGDKVLHIELLRWADIMVIAPLSANTLGKIAGGLCDRQSSDMYCERMGLQQATFYCTIHELFYVETPFNITAMH